MSAPTFIRSARPSPVRPSRPPTPSVVRNLLAATLTAMVAVAVLHGLAARWHTQDARHAGRVLAGELPPPPPPAPPAGLSYSGLEGASPLTNPAVRAMHIEHRADERRIAWLLAGSALLGLTLAAAAYPAWRYRRLLAGWALAAATAHAVFLAAGVASRSNLGLLGHTDQVSWPWAAAMTLELTVVALATALAAQPRAWPRP
jgi:hypothetical protein